jgi:hypothetical protein
MAMGYGAAVHHAPVGKWLCQPGPIQAGTLPADEILRPEVATRRRARAEARPPDMTELPQRPVVTGEAGSMTRPVMATGRVCQGPRDRHAPLVSPIATCHHRGRRLA